MLFSVTKKHVKFDTFNKMNNNKIYYLSILIYVSKLTFCADGYIGTTRLKRQLDKCVLPPYPEHGKWEAVGSNAFPGEEVALLTLLIFSCDAYYKLSTASPYVICNGDWNINNMPKCEKMCPPIFSSATTTVSCKYEDQKVNCHQASDGVAMQFSCAPYYEAPLGSKKIIYCNKGQWSAVRPSCQPVCGRRVNNDVLPIIAGGTVLKTIQFPWIIALYKNISSQYNYICGGSILSRKVAVTAAHCVTDNYGNSMNADDFQVAGGKLHSHYRDARDPNAQYIDIERVIVHSQYKGDSRRYVGDIALLVTKEMFRLDTLIQPVCFNGVGDISLHVGNIGEIASWGNTETNQISDELRFLSIPYKNNDVCEEELPSEWAEKYNLLDKMCAGFRNQSKSVCKGDSGSALAFKNPEDNRYYIHGVASLAPVSAERKCNIQQNALYTKVSFYYEFIDRWVNIYSEDNCVLRPYPANGQYSVVHYPNKGPGDAAFSDDVLSIQCNPGYFLTGATPRITCDIAKMPTCQSTTSIISGTTIGTSKTSPINIKVICTFTSLAWYNKTRFNQDVDVNLCTHIHFSIVEISDIIRGRTTITRDWSETFSGLKNEKPDLKILFDIDDFRGLYTIFSQTAKSAKLTDGFIERVKKFMINYNLDGININWKLPVSEKDIYITFLKKIKEAFKEKGWLVTVTCSFNLEGTGYSPREMNSIVDYVIIKTYDMYAPGRQYTGQHAALYAAPIEDTWEKKHLNIDAVVNNWLKAGLTKDKLVISVVFYARRFTLKNEEDNWLHAPTTTTAYGYNVIKYSEFCRKYNTSDWSGVWNDDQKTTFYFRAKEWISVDTKAAIWLKGAYAKDKELFGVHVWAADNDDVFGECGPKWELLKHLRAGIGY